MRSVLWIVSALFFSVNAMGNDIYTKQVPGTARQFLVATKDRLLGYEYVDQEWKEIFSYPAVIGKKGFANKNEKREGDGKTPSGVFGLGTTFGYAETVKTKMSYRQATKNDKFVDDVDHPDYNKWVTGETTAKSFEIMRRDDHQYEFGIVINYNMDPVTKGNGSAIFLHVWKSPKDGTAGCVAVARENLMQILSWLDPENNPVILLNPASR